MTVYDYNNNNILKNVSTNYETYLINTADTFTIQSFPVSGVVPTYTVQTLGAVNAPGVKEIEYPKLINLPSPFKTEIPETWEDFLGYIKDWLEFAENDLAYLKANQIKKMPEALKIIAGTLKKPEEFENLVMETKNMYLALKEEHFDIVKFLCITMCRGHNYIMSDVHSYVLKGLKKFRNISCN